MRHKRIVTGVVVVAMAAAGVGVASALGAGGESDDPATGPGADQARAAALVIVEGGTVNSVERDGENGATWEVEVTRPDGSTADVRLDSTYRLVAIESDQEHADGAGSDAGEE
jgi:hypothetical protein